MKKYKVFNPEEGQYYEHFTLEKCHKEVFQGMWNMYIKHTHGHPYVVVTINEDGSERWASPSGEDLTEFQQLSQAIEQRVKDALAALTEPT
jgi:hypothetical protein